MTLGEGIEQLYVFAVFFALGLGFSLIYIFGVGLTKSKLAAIIYDSVFGAGAIFVVWKTNLEINNGEFRAFIFIGLALGCVTTYFTCKSTLDKLSAMLYNLFTTKFVEKGNGTDILQEVNIDNIRSGNAGAGAAGLHAVSNTDSMVVTKPTRRRVKRDDTAGARKRRRPAKATRVSSNRRLRKGVGRKTRSN